MHSQNQKLVLSPVFSDHMILQRRKPIRIWGYCNVDDKIRVKLGAKEVVAIIEQGCWTANLPPMEATANAELIVLSSSGEQIRVRDVAIGEVWIAGGQSNMEFRLKYDAEADKVLTVANHTDIRYFETPKVSFDDEIDEDINPFGKWRTCSPVNAADFSAVAYYFALRLFENLQIPVGIITCTWSGTSAAAWLSEEYLNRDTGLNIYLQEYQEAIKDLNLEEYERQVKLCRQLYLLPSIVAALDRMNAGTATEDIYTTLAPLLGSPYIKQLGPKHYNRPNGLYHTMVKEIAGYTAQGVIWYQGEADAPKAFLYDKLFTALIECWRETWEDELPFLFVQLAPFRDVESNGEGFPYIRDQQEKVSKNVQKTYMASIMDMGMEFDVHPKRKRPVGERLALLALGKVYGQNIFCEAPEVDQVMKEGNCIRITFHHAGERLVVHGDKLNGLQVIAGQRPVQYTTEVKGNNLFIILNKQVTDLETINIRFACSDYEEVNLYNSANLPAKPFKITI
ncbi:hypothetical protein KDC22_24125 [Paenibacillus tritici]|uniref:sialate O-acetylesterase n=1 Tax=Paenibacillus tritici TaxID=1873425 RepID=UPI001BA507F5|nr:sialate O-acetylesterase [Paenibacillus tritici]QUL53453.1 hypothetical protein KDC22_24125 [Paenibacillus tritici]